MIYRSDRTQVRATCPRHQILIAPDDDIRVAKDKE
jgi:hypothetical protein